MTLADTFDRELAAIPKGATRRYIAERLAKVADEHKPTTLPRLLCVHPTYTEDGLAAQEFRRMRQQITDLRARIAKLEAEKGEQW